MASGHRAHAASWRRHGQRLGHLGHLGHCFLFVSWRQHGHALGHLGHCFLGDPNDLKAKIWRPGFGSFGSFCHARKIGGGRGV